MFALDPKNHLTDPDRKRSFNTVLFTEVAPRYDTITRLLSFGRDRIWKDRLIAMLPPLREPVCLDLACGTGDLSRRLRKRYPEGRVLGIDRTEAMLARARACCAGANVEFLHGDMERIPLPDESVDVVTGGYALRNAGSLSGVLAEVRRVLRPGGDAAFLDFSTSDHAMVRRWQLRLLKCWGGCWGLLLHRNPNVYGYIADSLALYPARRELASCFRDAGFDVEHRRRFFGGMVEADRLRRNPDGNPVTQRPDGNGSRIRHGKGRRKSG